MLTMRFDQHGWFDDSTRERLRVLRDCGDALGWSGVSPPPVQVPYFVSGALSAVKAVELGMPSEAAMNGRVTSPSKLLD